MSISWPQFLPLKLDTSYTLCMPARWLRHIPVDYDLWRQTNHRLMLLRKHESIGPRNSWSGLKQELYTHDGQDLWMCRKINDLICLTAPKMYNDTHFGHIINQWFCRHCMAVTSKMSLPFDRTLTCHGHSNYGSDPPLIPKDMNNCCLSIVLGFFKVFK